MNTPETTPTSISTTPATAPKDPLKTILNGLNPDDIEEVAALVNRLKMGAARKKVCLATYMMQLMSQQWIGD